MRLLFYQYGDYADAALRFASGGAETYYAQKYTVDFVASLVGQPGVEDVTVLSFSGVRPEMRLPSGVRCIGFQLYPKDGRTQQIQLFRHLERLRPTHLVMSSPQPLVIAWALARGIRLLPMFADSFRVQGAKARLKFAVLARLLNNRRIRWVSNHNLAASLDLVRIGVDGQKVVPFDWPAFERPQDRPVKSLREGNPFKLFYVGQINELKGVGDLLEALRILNGDDGAGAGSHALTIAGGHDGVMEARAKQMGLADAVRFLGRIPHDDIVPLMNQHDAVVVPSRHEYPEGLPMTIYEGICSRTPLVVSDHPMFRLKIQEDRTALVFPAGDPAQLAERIRRLRGNPALYRALSQAADASAEQFFCPLKFHELISRWLSDGPDDHQHLARFSIASGRYNQPPGL